MPDPQRVHERSEQVREFGDILDRLIRHDDAQLHDPERGLWLCWESHSWLHDHPADAQLLGLLRAVRA